jgi:hypothetical protein
MGIGAIKLNTFSTLCKKCSHERTASNNRTKIEVVAKIFEDGGCKLLDTNYINGQTPLKYQCSCGNISTVRLTNFMSEGARCGCGISKISGENSHMYNYCLTDDERQVRRIFPEYNEWRKAVYEKHDYTCICCGQHGGKLSAHHICNYSDNIELRTDPNNGVPLCYSCHMAYHSIYGIKHNTLEQLQEFIECNKEYHIDNFKEAN